jgi:hypothetical protein
MDKAYIKHRGTYRTSECLPAQETSVRSEYFPTVHSEQFLMAIPIPVP